MGTRVYPHCIISDMVEKSSTAELGSMKQSFKGVRMSSTVLVRKVPRLNSSFTNSLQRQCNEFLKIIIDIYYSERYSFCESKCLPVRVINICPNHLHSFLPYPTGANVPPESQVQDEPQRAGKRASEHHRHLGQPGESWCQLESVTGAYNVRHQFNNEKDEETTGEGCRDNRAQCTIQEHTQH